MDETTRPSTPPPEPTPPPPPAATGADAVLTRARRMRRPTDRKVLAGVCAGLARELGVDPLLVRVVVVLLAIFGGTGVVIYALGWLLIPADGRDDSLAAQVLGRGREPARAGTIVLGVVLAVVALIVLGTGLDKWFAVLLTTLAVVGAVLLLQRRPATAGAHPAASTYGSAGTGPYPTDTYPRDTYSPTAAVAPVPPAGAPPAPVGPPLPPPPPAPPRPPRSALFGVTVSTALLSLGVLALVDSSGATVPGGAYWALALAVVGAGLVVGTRYGRSRGLVVVGLVLSLGTLGSMASDGLDPNKVDVLERPTTVAELPPERDYAAGSVLYDLTAVDFTGADERVRIGIGAGEVVVLLPPDVDVTVRAAAGVGQLDLFDTQAGGFGRDRTVTDLGADGAGGGTLDLVIEAGAGHVEVRRG